MDAHERHQSAPVLLQRNQDRSRERSARLRARLRRARVGRRRPHLPRRSFGESASRLPRARHSPGQRRSPPKPPKPEDKNKPPKPQVCAARLVRHGRRRLLRATPPAKAGSISRVSRPVSSTASRSTIRSRIYRIAGGLQDNTNWVGPTGVQSKDGIINARLDEPRRRRRILRRLRSGTIATRSTPRASKGTSTASTRAPARCASCGPSRRKVSRPFVFTGTRRSFPSKHKPGTVYLAGNRVFRLTERGEKFALISPDLTRNDPERTNATGSGAENFGVVYSLAESPHKAGLLWAGTDDGRLWITENDGAKWTELTQNLPENCPRQVDRAHRSQRARSEGRLRRAERLPQPATIAPMIVRTTDRGATWQSVVGEGLPNYAPVEVIREDPGNPRLLYVGTHFGLFASIDGGAKWMRLADVPAVRVDDLEDSSAHSRSRHRARTAAASAFSMTRGRCVSSRRRSPRSRRTCSRVGPVNGAYLLGGWDEWAGKGGVPRQEPARRRDLQRLGEGIHRRRDQDRASRTPPARRSRT